MDNQIKISVITPSYNSENTIAETIESVLAQTYMNFEYLIIDGKSSDKTIEIAESYKSLFVEKGIEYRILSEKDTGIYNAMNKGINLATGDVVGIINSDDYYENIALESVAAKFSETNFDVMYADLRIVGAKKEIIKAAKTKKKFSTRDWNHPTTFVKKEIYDEFKYVEESIYDDLNFMLTARENGKKIVVVNKVLANFRFGGISNQKSWKKRKERIELRNSIYKNHNQKGYRFNNWLIETAKYFMG